MRHGVEAGSGRRARTTGAVPLAVLRRGTVLLAALTSLWGLGRQPLWFDELASAHASALPWSGLRALLQRTDANLGTYYALLHVWRVLGNGALALRLPSALAAVATVVLVERVGRRLLGPGPAVLAAALLAVNPFAVAYARDARPYALVSLCCTAALLLGLRAVTSSTAGSLAGYAAVAGCAVYLHLYAALPLAAAALALLPPAGRSRRRWLAVHAVLALGTLPLLYVSLGQQQQVDWVPPLSVGRLCSGLALLAGGPLPLLAVIAGLGLLLAERRRTPRDALLAPDPAGRLLLAGVLGPVLALLLVSAVHPTFVPRYLVATVPVQCLVLANAAVALRRRLTLPWMRFVGRTAAAVCLLWLGSGTVLQVAAPFHYENYRAATRALLAAARPGDGVVYAQQGARLGLEYYAAQGRHAVVGPTDLLVIPGARAAGFTVAQWTGLAAARALAPYRRVWLVSHLDAGPAVLPLLSHWGCGVRRSVGGVGLSLCTAWDQPQPPRP